MLHLYFKRIKKILKAIKALKFWSPNNPDISPIEKVWSFILRKLEGKNLMILMKVKRLFL